MSLGTISWQANPLDSSARRIVPAHFSWESKAATRIAVGTADVGLLSVIGKFLCGAALGARASRPWPIQCKGPRASLLGKSATAVSRAASSPASCLDSVSAGIPARDPR